MNTQVIVPLPLNVAPNDVHLFEPYNTYSRQTQKIKKLKNVFVTPMGYCMNSKGLIKECHHDYPGQYHNYLKEALYYYQDVTDNPENLVILDDDHSYLLIHHPWFNYYHWISESIFRLWLVRHKLESLTLILPEDYKDFDFIMGSLEPFNITKIFFIPRGKSLMVKNLCLPQIKPLCDSYNSNHVKQVRQFYRNYVFAKKEISVQRVERLYISREFANRRRVVNEGEVLEIIKKHGFTVFYPEKHPFLYQVAIFCGVKFLVGEHSSGITNMLFMEEGTSLLELHKNKTNELDHPSPLFWYMAEALGINYYHQVCETSGIEDYFSGDYIVDTELLEENLTKMLNGRNSKSIKR